MGISKTVSIFLLLAGLLLIVVPAVAQQSTGMITGTVQDSQGGIVPDAKVTVINQAQGTIFRQLQTSSGGTFVITPVPAGPYTVEVDKPGFKTHTKTDVRLDATEPVGLPPITLELASARELFMVEVS